MDMLSPSAYYAEARPRVSPATPIVFVIDHDPSARESLKVLIDPKAGSRRRSARGANFSRARARWCRAAWCSTSHCRI